MRNMIRYIIKRILMIIPVVLAVAIIIFAVMYFAPGDRASMTLGPGATQEEIYALREQLGLNDPFMVQLGKFLFQTFIKFDFGTSYISGLPVAGELAARFPNTLILALSVIVTQLIIGLPLGMVAAIHRDGVIDHICMLIAVIGISAPAFWIGLELMIIFSLNLNWFPASGVASLACWVLPITANSLRGIAQMARQSRSSMLEVINSDFMVTARAKGVPKGRLYMHYALPNALIPVIQTMGNSFGTSLGGAVIIESVFSIPGIGQYMVEAISSRDYPIIRGTSVVLAIAFSLIMLLVDLAFVFFDPRIKAQYEGSVARKKKVKKAVMSNG